MTFSKPFNRRAFTFALIGIGVGMGGCAAPAARAARAGTGYRRKQVMALVVREAIDLGVPISLALAVAHAESNFDPRAESVKGARGEYAIDADRLWEPRVNVRLGLHFLRRLIDRYGGRVDWALSYYNGGSAVGPPSRARIIPATRPYIRKVNRLRAQYRRALIRGEV